jgi:hypothetical protein
LAALAICFCSMAQARPGNDATGEEQDRQGKTTTFAAALDAMVLWRKRFNFMTIREANWNRSEALAEQRRKRSMPTVRRTSEFS